MTRCGRCGFSYMISRMYRWDDNGTIVNRHMPDFRLLIYYSDLFPELFGRIEKELGIPILHIVFEAQRNAAKDAIEVIMGPLPEWVRRNPLVKQATVRFFCRLSIWLGTAYARVLSYENGKSGEAVLRNAYDRELMAALILGAFETLEKRPYHHEWKKAGDGDVVRVTATDDKPEVSERMILELEKPRPGGRHLPRCPRCGVPRALSPMVWNEYQGTITDTDRRERVNFLEAYANRVIFRELEEELGDAINPLIVEAAKDFALRHLERVPGIRTGKQAGRDEAWRAFTEEAEIMLAAWGHGNLVEIGQDGGKAVATVDNPFEERLVAGYLAAGFELVEGRQCAVEWSSSEPARVVFTLSGR